MGNEDHNSILRVINVLGQPVQSMPVYIYAQFSGEYDIDLSKLSKGFYYIIVQDNNSLLYKNGFIKQ